MAEGFKLRRVQALAGLTFSLYIFCVNGIHGAVFGAMKQNHLD